MPLVDSYIYTCGLPILRVYRSTAQRGYQCTSCGAGIEKGSEYHRYVYLSDGQWHTDRLCAHCQELVGWNTDDVPGPTCEVSFNEPIEDFFGAYTVDDLPWLVRRKANPLSERLARWLAGLYGEELEELKQEEQA